MGMDSCPYAGADSRASTAGTTQKILLIGSPQVKSGKDFEETI